MTQSNLSLMYASNLQAYFQQELRRMISSLGEETSEAAEAYVVYLLDEYTKPSDAQRAQLGFDRAAALMLHDAVCSPGDQSIEAYRQLGDACLYHCGLFERQLTRRELKSAYYKDMGKEAYARLGHIFSNRPTDHAFGSIFKELSVQFELFVEALKALAAQWHGEGWVAFDFDEQVEFAMAQQLFYIKK